jgi:hypothetical protein
MMLLQRLLALLTHDTSGSGTYNDPVTIATAPGELNVCEIVYLPLLTKYGRYEDDCAQCSEYTVLQMPQPALLLTGLKSPTTTTGNLTLTSGPDRPTPMAARIRLIAKIISRRAAATLSCATRRPITASTVSS